MEFLKRPIAITDVETSGFDAQIHEILEIGLVVVDQKNLKVLDEWTVKVKLRKIRTAAEKALKVCGYNKIDWLKAIDLKDAMKVYSKKTRNAIFLAHNSFFDWSFITEAFKQTGVEDYTDYHRLDLFSIAWALSRNKKLKNLAKFNLSELCKYFNIEPEPAPHRALNGARKALEVLRKLTYEA